MLLGRVAALATLVGALFGCAPSAPPPQAEAVCSLVAEGYGPRGMAALKAETVVSGLEVPWGSPSSPAGIGS